MPALLSDNNRASAEPRRPSVPSAAASAAPPSKQGESNFLEKREMAKKAEAELENSVSSRVDMSAKLEQDSMEGVDEREWVRL